MSVQGKRIVVVGASSGVGRSVAGVLAAKGARVVASARRQELGRELEAAAVEGGHDLTFVTADVRSSASADAVIAAAVERLGGIDVLVNCAGVEGHVGDLTSVTDEDWAAVLETNLTGAFYCIRAALPVLIEGGGGLILNVGSINGAPGIALAHMGPYNASKAGLTQLTNTVAVEYLFQNVRANTIILGGAEGETAQRVQQKLGRYLQGDAYEPPTERSAFQQAMIMDGEQLGATFALLCSDDAKLINGSTIAIDRAISAGFVASSMFHMSASGALQAKAPA